MPGLLVLAFILGVCIGHVAVQTLRLGRLGEEHGQVADTVAFLLQDWEWRNSRV